ncbi:Longevity assurance, LAG1/LAC1 [Cynara cardunculus var. scolymus]|uniref:Longevity assurance, LAG1/LAC1 n=1 Tax=Cynara cardunculus var. scolymus TaxID=59895 RepID=A0A103XVA6_CYNCS|nr:Longevity assurance, LAG1/LAC1 [Cynara cardunculus var. scolymus]
MGFIEVLPSFDFEHESYPTYQDFAVLPLFAIFFPTARYFLDVYVFEGIGRRLIFGKEQQRLDVETEERKKKIRKFKESAWKCVYYLSAEILALVVTHDEPWFTNTTNFWTGLYMYAGGFYTYSIFALVFWETRRADFGVSMGHHVATLILIVMSYICRFVRVGSIVLALHDGSDVFLEVGKMSKYSGAEGLAGISFVLFMLSWLILRLIIYPFWVLWSTSYELVPSLNKEKYKTLGPIYYYAFNTLLFSLLVLHIYWWVLIFRMFLGQLQAKGKLSDDVRSDSDSDNEHED